MFLILLTREYFPAFLTVFRVAFRTGFLPREIQPNMPRERYAPKPFLTLAAEPFESVEEAWFWSVQCLQARREGARVGAGRGETLRPCDPDDVVAAIYRLYRQRRLNQLHLGVLAEYGKRLLPPDERRAHEGKAATLWHEAIERLTGTLRAKGIVR